MIRTEIEKRDAGLVARVTFDNPAKLNILTREALAEIRTQTKAIEANPEVRAVVVTGARNRIAASPLSVTPSLSSSAAAGSWSGS